MIKKGVFHRWRTFSQAECGMAFGCEEVKWKWEREREIQKEMEGKKRQWTWSPYKCKNFFIWIPVCHNVLQHWTYCYLVWHVVCYIVITCSSFLVVLIFWTQRQKESIEYKPHEQHKICVTYATSECGLSYEWRYGRAIICIMMPPQWLWGRNRGKEPEEDQKKTQRQTRASVSVPVLLTKGIKQVW